MTESVSINPVRKGLFSMLWVWTRSIGWTIALSTVLAVVFALALDGCSRVH